MEGNKANKKLNANDDARMLSEPFCIPLKKNLETTYTDNPSKPGNTSFLLDLMILNAGLNFMMRLMFLRCIVVL